MDITSLKNSGQVSPLRSPLVNGADSPRLSPITKKSSKRSRDRVRRWTTDIDRTHLIRLPVNDGTRDDSVHLSQDMIGGPMLLGVSNSSLSSWGSTELESSSELNALASQQDLFQEMAQGTHLDLNEPSNHQYQLSYDLAIENSPLSPSAYSSTHCSNVIKEMVTTERTYVADLSDVIEVYFKRMCAMADKLPLSLTEVEKMFGNIAEIRAFHSELLEKLLKCGQDYCKIGVCFIGNAEGFKIYTQYCTNYPESVKTLVRLSGVAPVAQYMRQCQQQLNHTLPLGAYLLKPVQRVFKYSLLLESLFKHLNVTDHGYREIQHAMGEMIRVAEHINSMKRKYDAAVHVQEIQSLLHDWEGGSLTKYGDIVLEDTFKVTPSKGSTSFRPSTNVFGASERYVFLFQRLILITKKKDDGFHYRKHIEMKDVQLTEHLKDPTVFQIRHIATHRIYTFQVQNAAMKVEWTQRIKNLLVESLPQLPEKTRMLILSGFTTDLTKLSTNTPERQRRKSSDLSHCSPGRRHSPKFISFDVENLTSDMDRVFASSKTLPRKMPHRTPGVSTSPLLHNTSISGPQSAGSYPTTEELPDAGVITAPAFRDSGFSESIPVADEVQPTRRLSSCSDSPPTSSSLSSTDVKPSSSYQFQEEHPIISSTNGTKSRRTRGYENNRPHSRDSPDDEIRSRLGRAEVSKPLVSHSASNSPVPPLPGSSIFSLERALTPPTITHTPPPTPPPVCMSQSTPNFPIHRLSPENLSSKERHHLTANGHAHGRVEEECLMEKDVKYGHLNSHVPLDSSASEYEQGTLHESATHKDLSTSQDVNARLTPSPPNPGRVICSTKSDKAADDMINIKLALNTGNLIDELDEPPRSPRELMTRKSLSLPHFTKRENFFPHQRPASGDYDGQEALFEDLMGSSSDLDVSNFSQILPEEDSAPSPSFSRAVKAALFGKVDFGHAFSQTQTTSAGELGNSQWHKNNCRTKAALSAQQGTVSGLPASVPEDESQTPQASPATQRKHYPLLSNSGSTQETVTPHNSPPSNHRLLDESSPDSMPPPPPTLDTSSSSVTSSSVSDTTIIPCPPQFASDSPELNRASKSPQFSRRQSDSFEDDNSSTASPANSRKEKSKTPEAALSKFKPFSAVRRAHSFSQARRRQRPISVIGLVHTTRDNSDLLELDMALRLKRMTDGRGSPILIGKGGSPILASLGTRRGRGGSDSGSPLTSTPVSSVAEKNSPIVRASTSSPTEPSRTSPTFDTSSQSTSERTSPENGASSPDSISATASSTNHSPKTVRWSLLRSKGHKQRTHKLDDETDESSPIGSDERSELPKVIEENVQFDAARAKFEPTQTATSGDNPGDTSLFTGSQETSLVTRRKGKLRKRRDKRSQTIAGTELELASMEQQRKPSDHGPYRVFKLAREYSRKIKERRQQNTFSTIEISPREVEEMSAGAREHGGTGISLSLSQIEISENSQTDPLSSSWLREHNPPTNYRTAAMKALSTTNIAELSNEVHLDSYSQTLSDGDKTPLEKKTFDLSKQTELMRKEDVASSSPEFPRGSMQGSKSFTLSRYTSVADEMMMKGVEVEERRRGRFGGWVKSLVNKFSK